MRAFDLRPALRVPLLVVTALALVFSAFAGDADAKKRKKKKSTKPSVTRIAPKQLAVGDRLVIKGKNFRSGAKANTVIFRRNGGGPQVFVRAISASKKLITVEIPPRLREELTLSNGAPQPTRFQIRIVSSRVNSGWSTLSKSPVILPNQVGSASADCDGDGVPDDRDGDDDNDGLSDALEQQYGLGVCNVDSDGDGIEDGYEFESALDLNIRALPYPFRTPWPNPLFSDRGQGAGLFADNFPDYDGDGLSLAQEHYLWKAAGRPFPLNYSDGQQHSGGFQPVAPGDPWGYDRDAVIKGGPISTETGVGYLSDDERDFDNDGLSNMAEFNMRMVESWWDAYGETYDEKPYTMRPFTPVLPDGTEGYASDPTLADTDGDTLIDGADDIDQDGWNNASEQYRAPGPMTGGMSFWVNPFNPCLPDYNSPTCSRYYPMEDPWAPFALGALPTTPMGWINGGPADSPMPGYRP